MRTVRVSGTENYAEEAPELLKRYESITFADAHRLVMHLIPTAPSRVLDIGSGTGRDAGGLAALGHSVAAVEPTDTPASITDDRMARRQPAGFGGHTSTRRRVRRGHDDGRLDASRRAAAPRGNAQRSSVGAQRRCGDDVAAARSRAAGTAHVRGLGRGNDSAGAAAGALLYPASGRGIVVAAARGHLDMAGISEGAAPRRRRSIPGSTTRVSRNPAIMGQDRGVC